MKNNQRVLLAIAFVFLFLLGLMISFSIYRGELNVPSFPNDPSAINEGQEVGDIVSFKSSKDFKAYIQDGRQLSDNYYVGDFYRNDYLPIAPELEARKFSEAQPDSIARGDKISADRYSSTNVQVVGIDELDIVKTDGDRIFISDLAPYARQIQIEPEEPPELLDDETGIYEMPSYETSTTKVVKAFPLKDISLEKELKETGNMLLTKDSLIVISSSKVTGYSLDSLEEKWEYGLQGNSMINDARSWGDEVLIVMRSYIDTDNPCPIPLLDTESGEDQYIEAVCSDIHHPETAIEVDTVYSFLKFDSKTGKVLSKNSFVGSSNQSNIYVSEDNIYLAYTDMKNRNELIYDFYVSNLVDLFPSKVSDRISEIAEYNISYASKAVEIERVIQGYLDGLSEKEQEKLSNIAEKAMEEYMKKVKREVVVTGIVKFDKENLSIQAHKKVPGRLLNQFSMDEYKGFLRVATTVGADEFFWDEEPSTENDLYVLSSHLDTIASVEGLGKGERIYSIRFDGDMGYIVTFRETDPFYIINLKDPQNPSLEGELKIPGYSSYLHKLNNNLILGIGKDGSYVKLSLFDISDLANPKEITKYLLKREYWSEVLDNHHAFMLDSRNSIFFIPTSNGGYIFKFTDSDLSIVKDIKDASGVLRALYIDNYLYIVGENKLTVFDEDSWKQVENLEI